MEPGELPDFYRSDDVLLHTSFFDPFPNAVMEAMACGTPIVGSDKAGSVLDRVVEGKNGYMHEAGNLKDITEKIRMIFERKDRLPEMGKEARKTAEEWQVNYHIKTINELLNE